uniref:SFRICE_028493 n=1 Tax=Spodoptera frugiperda TaxID=7108 RepID=A0A2H1WEP7_SPOFR
MLEAHIHEQHSATHDAAIVALLLYNKIIFQLNHTLSNHGKQSAPLMDICNTRRFWIRSVFKSQVNRLLHHRSPPGEMVAKRHPIKHKNTKKKYISYTSRVLNSSCTPLAQSGMV